MRIGQSLVQALCSFCFIAIPQICLAQQVEIQINEIDLVHSADNPDDDYVTWAPTFCRARLVGASSDITVVLTNDHPAYYLFVGGENSPLGKVEIGDRFYCFVDGQELRVDAATTSPTSIVQQIETAWNTSTNPNFQRFTATAEGTAVVLIANAANDSSTVTVATYESDGAQSDGQTFLQATKGDVQFADHESPWPANQTATSTSVQLDLTADSAWHPFVIAGTFGRSSAMDKDTVIEAHRNAVDGAIIGQKRLMVRVRKNAEKLSEPERDKFSLGGSRLESHARWLGSRYNLSPDAGNPWPFIARWQ